jgi:phosphoenolpyruvate carboxykinase (GTP)
VTPQFKDLNWDGIDFTQQQFDTITSVDKAAWLEEVALHAELFERLQQRLPQELVDAKAQLEQRLAQ